ncbi:MAG: ABC-2 family transporter protein [Oscillospiraceae bacterium]|jgi:ABC-2 type transport system permease protein|nr:ABC-2 family transporter protein [Oscillospiraceae bacterium]
MNSLLKYKRAYALGLKSKLEYRFDFLMSIASCAFTLIVLTTLWRAIFSNSGAEKLYGYSFQQMLFYVISSTLLSKMITTDIMNVISNDIKDGGLNKFLVQPFSYSKYRLSVLLGEKTCEALIILILIIALLIILPLASNSIIGFSSFLLSLIPILLSTLLNFYLSFILATLAFWVTDTFYLNFGLNVVILILSGAIFPIDVLPKMIVNISRFLPFQYIIFFPVKVLTGNYLTRELSLGILIQVGYILILGIASKLFWNYGVSKHIAVGG